MTEHILDFLSPQVLRDYADSGSFGRGEDYFKSGSVFGLEEYGGKIVAQVSGTSDYKVELWAQGEDELGYDCDCHYAAEGNFCKHFVAVGLAWIAQRKGEISKKSSKKKGAASLDDVKAYLQTREKSELVEMLMQQVLENDTLRGQLMLAVARNNPQGVDIKTYRKEIKRVFKSVEDDYGEYYGNFDSEDVENVVESIENLFEDGHFETVIDLCEYGLKKASKVLNYVHESDGTVEDAMEKFQDIHHSACEKAKPDVEILANRLFEWELTDGWGVFHNAAENYADVLGKKGLQIYRQLIEKEWAEIPALKPNDQKSFGGNRYRITNMMESLAIAEDDIEKLVEIKSRDLSNQYRYYEIAELYRENKQYDNALEWAERGISDFPAIEKLDWRLGEFLANEYHRRNRHDEAMQIIWTNFAERPDLGNYNKLKEHADKVKPTSTWHDWREKALTYIRQDIAERKKTKSFGWSYQRADNSLPVTIFLQENLPEQAWQEASEGGCSEDLWLKLAKMREKEHPSDALKIYQDRIEPKIKETNNQAYDQAVKWIKEVKRLMTQLDQEDEFENYLVALRVNYKIKRNFIKLLDSTKW